MIEHEVDGGPVTEPARELPVDGEYDVVVVGGGMAGVGAGIAAARLGCRTLLLESQGALGGLATLGLVNIPLDFICGIGTEMMRRLKEMDGLWHRNTDPEKHKLLLDRMVKESGCELVLCAPVVDSIVRKGAICGVVVQTKTGRRAILAKRVVDASGDGDAAYYAGCECMVGRLPDGLSQACSLEFRLGGVDWDKYVNSELKANDPRWEGAIAQALKDGDLPYEVDNHLNWITHVPGRPEHCGADEVSICLAHSRRCRPLDVRDLTRMYVEGREQADFLWRFIRKRIPGFERCWLVDTAPLIGVRESRRIVGEHVLNGWDIATHARYDDVVTISSHGYDLHNPDGPGNIKWIEHEIDGRVRYVIFARTGFNTTVEPPGGKAALCDCKGRTGDQAQFPDSPYYDIPYRSLVPAHVDNILVAGRCLSADFMAQSGCRLVLCCLNMGQAAGTAAALSLRYNVPPRKLDRITLQRQLIADGMNLGQYTREIPGLEQGTSKP